MADYRRALALDPRLDRRARRTGARRRVGARAPAAADADRRQRAVPDSRRRRRHRDLPARSARRAGRDRLRATSISSLPIARRARSWRPKRRTSRTVPQPVRAASRPARILWEQTAAARRGRAPATGRDVQSRLHGAAAVPVPAGHGLSRSAAQAPSRSTSAGSICRSGDFFLFWSGACLAAVIAVSDATAADLRRFYRVARSENPRRAASGVEPAFFDIGAAPPARAIPAGRLHPASAQESRRPADARSPTSARRIPNTA